MRLGNLVRSGLAAAATFGFAAVASGQTWYAAPTPDNLGTGAYWNNRSFDNVGPSAVCNIGAVLMGMTTNPMCNNQVPSPLLGLDPAQQLPGSGTRGTFLGGATPTTAAGFMFGAGSYTFDLYGRVAGFASSSPPGPRMGYYTFDSFGARVLTELLVGATAGSQLFTTTANWGFWLTTYAPGTGSAGTGPFDVWFSDMAACTIAALTSCTPTGGAVAGSASQQFALFSSTIPAGTAGGSPIPVGSNQRFWIGGEDIACRGGTSSLGGSCPRVGDWDYQDVVGSFAQIPEPASVVLVGTGLIGLLGVGRRRRTS